MVYFGSLAGCVYAIDAITRQPKWAAAFKTGGSVKERVIEALRAHFRPEFLNRLDDIVVFHALTMEDLKRIVEIQLGLVAKRLVERKITLELTDAAKELLVREGYDPQYGARPLRRTIQRRILDPLALQVLNGTIHDGEHIVVDVNSQSGDFVFVRQKREPVHEPVPA